MRRYKVGNRNALDGICKAIGLARIAGFHEIVELSGAVIFHPVAHNLDRARSLKPLRVRIHQHFQGFMAGINRPFITSWIGDYQGKGLMILGPQ